MEKGTGFIKWLNQPKYLKNSIAKTRNSEVFTKYKYLLFLIIFVLPYSMF